MSWGHFVNLTNCKQTAKVDNLLIVCILSLSLTGCMHVGRQGQALAKHNAEQKAKGKPECWKEKWLFWPPSWTCW